jgi:hypothetical protein
MTKFQIQPIPEIIQTSMKSKNIWAPNCPASFSQLRLLTLSHYDFDGNLQEGEMITHEKIAANVIIIFQELLKIKFPIAKIQLIDNYNGNDELSMADNNSSCFNNRLIPNSDLISMHSYGLAIDINPVQNPYIVDEQIESELKIWPDSGKSYLNRTNQRPGMVEPIVPIFTKNGLNIWGGNWNYPVDYHHFQVDRGNLGDFV